MKKTSALLAALLFAAPAFGASHSGPGVITLATSCPVSSAAGGPVTLTGTVPINAQIGTTYTILATDCGKALTLSNGSAVAVTLPQAGTTGFPAGFFIPSVVNLGAGTVTITPTTSTINGAATLTLATGQSASLVSDGTNYVAALGKGSGGGSVTTSCGLTGTTALKLSEPTNAQTGTSYTFVDGDCGKLVTHSNAAATADTLPQANGSTFVAGWQVEVSNLGAGTVTITPTTSAIDGKAVLVLATGQGAKIVSDGTNYFTRPGLSGGAQNFGSGLWTLPRSGTTRGTVAGVANTIRCVPFVQDRPATAGNLGTRITTLAASGLIALAIYPNNAAVFPNRPTGSPIISTTGITTGATGAVNGTSTTAGQIPPGLNWACANNDTTAGVTVLTEASAATGPTILGQIVGTATQATLNTGTGSYINGVTSTVGATATCCSSWVSVTGATWTESQAGFPQLEILWNSQP